MFIGFPFLKQADNSGAKAHSESQAKGKAKNLTYQLFKPKVI